MKTTKKIIAALMASAAIFINYQIEAKPVHYNHLLPNGLVFQLEIGPVNEPISESVADRFEMMEETTNHDGSRIYYAGKYKDFNEAKTQEMLMNLIGYEEVEVIAYFNKRNISMTDAFTLMDDQNKYDEQFISIEELNAMIDANNGELDLYYTVQVGVYSYHKMDTFIDEIGGMDVHDRGDMVYSIGKFPTMEDAREVRTRLSKNIKGTYIAPYLNDKRISPMAAAKIEEYVNKTR